MTKKFVLYLNRDGSKLMINFGISGYNFWVSLIARLDFKLEHGPGTQDWNMGLECGTGQTEIGRKLGVLIHLVTSLKLVDVAFLKI